jgi:hypothetical protein
MTIAVPKPVQQPSQFILDRPKYDRVEAQTRFFREKARAFVRGQDVLFHGTRYRQSVLASGILRFTPGTQRLSFTFPTLPHTGPARRVTMMRELGRSSCLIAPP